jgi:P27 family predicted phage terminase small subunit
MRGRKPNPSWRRVLEGNPGKRAINGEEPQPPTSEDLFDQPPPAIAAQPLAAAEWARLAPMLRKARQITDADRSSLIALCLEWGRYLDALERVRTSGMVVLTPSGFPMPNPYLSIARQSLAACARLWPELGLTPSSRSRVRAADVAANDPFAEFDTPPPLGSKPS